MNIHWSKLWTGICHKQHSLYNKNQNNNNKLLTKLRQGVKRIGIIGSVEKRKVRTSGSCEHLLSGHLTSLKGCSRDMKWGEGRRRVLCWSSAWSVSLSHSREKDCRMDNALRQQTLEATQVFLTLWHEKYAAINMKGSWEREEWQSLWKDSRVVQAQCENPFCEFATSARGTLQRESTKRSLNPRGERSVLKCCTH